MLAVVVIAACGVRQPGPTPIPAAADVIGPDECTRAGEDSDRDGLTDQCETSLASAFAPVLVTAPDTCMDPASPPRGAYLHGAQPVGDAVRLVYLPAYFIDCGFSGPKCRLPLVECSPHVGDSEFIAIDVVPADGAWAARAVFLSAHCFGRADGNCRWYRGRDLERFAWAGGAPIVWVSEGKHANYPSRAACDRGHYAVDTCDRNAQRYRFPVAEGRNIGSETEPGIGSDAGPGCLLGAAVGSVGEVEQDAVECFWSDRPFRGWQGQGEGVTPYRRYLKQVAGYQVSKDSGGWR